MMFQRMVKKEMRALKSPNFRRSPLHHGGTNEKNNIATLFLTYSTATSSKNVTTYAKFLKSTFGQLLWSNAPLCVVGIRQRVDSPHPPFSAPLPYLL